VALDIGGGRVALRVVDGEGDPHPTNAVLHRDGFESDPRVEVVIELVGGDVVEDGHEAVRAQRAVSTEVAPEALQRFGRRPHHEMAAVDEVVEHLQQLPERE
jgi:hypothetical protein